MTDSTPAAAPGAPQPVDIARGLDRLLLLADRVPGDATGHDLVLDALAGAYVELKGAPSEGCEAALADLARAFARRGARCALGIVVGPEGVRVVDLDAE